MVLNNEMCKKTNAHGIPSSYYRLVPNLSPLHSHFGWSRSTHCYSEILYLLYWCRNPQKIVTRASDIGQAHHTSVQFSTLSTIWCC